MPVALPELLKLMADPKRDVQACAAEVLAGLVRGAGDWPLSHQQALWAELREPLGKTLRACSIESLQDWQSCLRFCAFNRDPRRIAWLVALLEQAAESALERASGVEDTSLAQANHLRFLAPLVVELGWKGLPLFQRLLRSDVLRSWVSHPYRQVREST